MKKSDGIIRVMSFNLRFGLADDKENRWELRKKALAPLFSRFEPDFIAVQEANGFQKDFLADLLPGHSLYGARTPAPEFWQHNAVYYRKDWRLSRFRHFFLSDTPDIPSRFAQSRWPRQCSLGLLTKDGKSLLVADTHFDFAPEVQDKSAVLIQEALQEAAPGLPAVICGDFNARPESSCHLLFTQGPPRRDAALGEPFRDALEPVSEGTHHGFSGKADEATGRIDWILYRGGLCVEESFVITESFEGFYPSDHFPVMAVFRLPPAQGT